MRKRVNARVEHRIMQVLCVFLLLAFLAVMLYVEFRHSGGVISRESAKLAEYTYKDDLAGYVFRAETTVTDGGKNGVLQYLVSDGTAVTKDQAVIAAYEISREQNERERAAVLFEEIAYLERSLTDDNSWQQAYMESYVELMRATGADDWQTGANAASAFALSLQQGGVAVGGDAAAVRAKIEALRSEIAALVEYAGTPYSARAAIDGYFCSTVDGYENYFGSSAWNEGLTPEKLDDLLQLNNIPDRAVGKVVSSGRFCMAVPIDATRAAAYTVGETYTVRMTRGGEADMLLERVTYSAAGDSALLMLSADAMPVGMDFARRQTLEIERATVSGISVPDSALCTEGEATFVYVIEGGVAHRRRVELLCRTSGCCIVAVQGEDGSLRAGERVLLDAVAAGIYEGMVLNK